MNDLGRNAKQIGNAIRRARKIRSLSQKELAEKTGLRQATISQIENGTISATIDTILGLLAVLDLEFQIRQRTKARTIEPIS
jgi:HTH-type transcriptional regulator / antitoxin HipB